MCGIGTLHLQWRNCFCKNSSVRLCFDTCLRIVLWRLQSVSTKIHKTTFKHFEDLQKDQEHQTPKQSRKKIGLSVTWTRKAEIDSKGKMHLENFVPVSSTTPLNWTGWQRKQVSCAKVPESGDVLCCEKWSRTSWDVWKFWAFRWLKWGWLWWLAWYWYLQTKVWNASEISWFWDFLGLLQDYRWIRGSCLIRTKPSQNPSN